VDAWHDTLVRGGFREREAEAAAASGGGGGGGGGHGGGGEDVPPLPLPPTLPSAAASFFAASCGTAWSPQPGHPT
jgi:hypothetical protein